MTKTKKFDSVKIMRDIRKDIDREISNMSPKQVVDWLKNVRQDYQKAIAR